MSDSSGFKVEMVEFPSYEQVQAVKELALRTISKRPVNEASFEWLCKIVQSEHSPIRSLVFKFDIEAPYWVLNELRTHHTGNTEMWMESSRNDRQSGFDRNDAPQGMLRRCYWQTNLQTLMDIAKVRLCQNASSEMRVLVRMLCHEVEEEYPWTKGMFAPKCAWSNGECREFQPCGMNEVYKRLWVEWCTGGSERD